MNRTEVAAIYFPSWHPDAHYSAWYGPGFTEWELIKKAKPLYPGHHQPKQPSWGHFDESDPVWAAKQIDLAAEHGITAFMFDWYWYQGVQILHKALEDGFLQAENREKLKFFLMWANHEWWNWPAVTGKPGMGQSSWLYTYHTIEDLRNVVTYCAENYFCQPNYLKIDGKPVFVFYQPNLLAEEIKRFSSIDDPIAHMNDQAQRCGFDGIYFIANIGCLGGNAYSVRWDMIPGLASEGYDAVYPYNLCSTERTAKLPRERPVMDYREIMDAHPYVWQQCENKGLVFHPSVSMGLDCSPRWHEGVGLPLTESNYLSFIDNCTPELFGQLFSMALEHLGQNQTDKRIVFINAWNEWTEGMYLLPEKKYGTGYLQAIKNAIEKAKAI